MSSSVLTHYNPVLPLQLAGDASAYGVGAVISHVMGDGYEWPIAFASRTLSLSKKNYSQIEKEALSLIFGVKKFHSYLYGRQFTLKFTTKQLRPATQTDPTLSKVLRYVRTGWPHRSDEELCPYWSWRFELTVEGGCVLWVIRVVAPRKLQQQLLEELHLASAG